MLLLHETHEAVGAREADFEAAYRDGWMPALACTDGARPLYFVRHAHGTGVSYNVFTVTLLRDGRAWDSLARELAGGAL